MVVPKKSLFRGISDCKIFPITADTSTAYTVGTGIDIPGIKSFSLEPNTTSDSLRGDDKTLDYYSDVREYKVTVECSELSLEAMAALQGGTVTSSGSTPNQKQVYSYDGGMNENYVQVGFKVDYVDKEIGDAQVYVMKVKFDAASFGSSDDAYAAPSFNGVAIMTTNESVSRMKEVVFNETAGALTARVSA